MCGYVYTSHRPGVGSGQPSSNEGTQWRGAHHMYVSGTAETVDRSGQTLLCSKYGPVHDRGVCVCVCVCVHM